MTSLFQSFNRFPVCRALLLLVAILMPSLASAHDIPVRVTVHAFVKPEGNQLTVLMRVPMEAFGEIAFPLRGPGFLQFAEADFALRDAARVYITDSIHFYEDGEELTDKELQTVRVALPSNRSFTSYESAL